MNNETIIKKLKTLQTIKPRSEWTTLNRAFLLRKIHPDQQGQAARFSWREYSFAFTALFRQRLLEPAVVILLVLGFSISSSLAVNASFYSLPGQSLYKVKIALENAQLAITPNEERQVELKIEFAQKRINEFDKIVAQSDVSPEVRKERITEVVKELQKNVASVQTHISKITEANQSLTDQGKGVRIALSISAETKEIVKSLDATTKNLSADPVDVKSIVAEAVESVQAVSQSADEVVRSSEEAADSQNQVESDQSATTTDEIIEPGAVLGEATTTENLLPSDQSATSTNSGSETTPDLITN